jgi:hypothetical protein
MTELDQGIQSRIAANGLVLKALLSSLDYRSTYIGIKVTNTVYGRICSQRSYGHAIPALAYAGSRWIQQAL